ncbi:MAG: ABC transporter ATP-binding protein [Verrucomicrobiae bacterium]|nr:ABC transporter ATP-binding protein [Verrucomicrobiae bacterium]
MALLEVRDLLVEYRTPDGGVLRALDVRRFDLAAGERRCLRGRSGSGKTTLLNAISGIRLPTAGCVRLDGKEITALAENARDRLRGRTIGFVFQAFHLLPGFTALQNVVLGSVFAGNPEEESAATLRRARELLRAVGLEARMHHRPASLSAGEQQRVAVARALMNRPKLLLADEPTGSLDAAQAGAVLDLILRLADEAGAALLLVTHDAAVMARFGGVTDLESLARGGEGR